MNDSTLKTVNNQIPSEVNGIIYEARRTVIFIRQASYAISSIGRVFNIDLTNKDFEKDSLNNHILGGLATAITLLSEQLDKQGDRLDDLLVDEGFANE